jgi:diguanylate cyclase (GGDEF)-like protein
VTVPYQLTSLRRSQGWASYRLTLTLMALSGLAVLALVFLAAFWAATESDAVAKERQRRLVHDRLQDQMDRAAHEIELMSVGFSSFLNRRSIASAPNDLTRVTGSAATFGQVATSVFGYDAAFVVNEAGDLLVPRDADSAKRYRWVKPLLMPLLGGRDYEADTASFFVSEGKPRTRVGLMKLEGRPSIAGAVPIVTLPHPDDARDPGTTGVYLVAFRFLDGAALDALSKEQGLAGARYSRTSDQDAHEIAFQINATATKDPIGFIIWAPELPGSLVVGRLAPVLSVSGLAIAVLFMTLMARLRSSLRKLSDSEETARHLALHDPLTDLPNRTLFAEQLEQCREKSCRQDGEYALALLDLDHFKEVNDTFGHAVGDELLQAAVARMRTVIGPQHLLARLGGDEFALLVDCSKTSERAVDLCTRIVAEAGKPYRLCQDTITARVGCSAGLAVHAKDIFSSSDWLRRADVALYVAKTQGKNRTVSYDRAFDEGTSDRERLKADLRRIFPAEVDPPPVGAVNMPLAAAEEFEVFFQSIHEGNAAQHLSGAEALVRWRHPQRGLLPPDIFLPIVEELGLMDRLGRCVLFSAVRAAASWPSTMTICVNVSPSQLKYPLFAEEVIATLSSFGFDPARLELELTEAALFKADESAKRALSRLRAIGIRIALDDFGTGYSSLSHLLQFNIDRIKIDRSFVQLLGTKAEGAAIVSAVLSLSKSLGTATTAEGVETPGQCDFLVSSGCGNLQGYLFSKPMEEQEFVSFMNARNQLKLSNHG